MDKRHFITSAALGAIGLPALATAKGKPVASPAMLTISGAIGRGNRGPIDPVLDQMMKKQGVQFDKAFTFDFAAITALPAVTIHPTLEYDARPHALSGPLLIDVIRATGAADTANTKLVLRAIDGYASAISMADARKYRYIVATHIDDKPMAIGGLGPLWALLDMDRFPEKAAVPLATRFGGCPWALYHIEVQA